MKQKLKTSERHVLQVSLKEITPQIQKKLPEDNSFSPSIHINKTPLSGSYIYVLQDSQKTITIMGLLLATNIILYFFWKTNVLNFSFLGL